MNRNWLKKMAEKTPDSIKNRVAYYMSSPGWENILDKYLVELEDFSSSGLQEHSIEMIICEEQPCLEIVDTGPISQDYVLFLDILNLLDSHSNDVGPLSKSKTARFITYLYCIIKNRVNVRDPYPGNLIK